MLFRSLLTKTPDWQSESAEERLAAVASLPPDSLELRQLFSVDPEASVRAAAASRLSQLPALRDRFDAEPDPEVRSAMVERAAALLAGTVAEAPALAARISALSLAWEPAVLEAAIAGAADAPFALAAIECVADDAALARIATTAPGPEVRAAAIDRVGATAILTEIARSLRGHDKSLWRRAQNRLDGMRTDARREGDAAALIAEAETLAASESPAPNQLAALDKAWQALGYDGEGADTFRTAVAQVRARLEARAASQIAANRLLAAANDIYQGLPADGSDRARVAEAAARLHEIASQWSMLPAVALPRAVVEQFGQRRRELEDRIGSLGADVDALARREALLTRIGAAIAVRDDPTTSALLGMWDQLPSPAKSPVQAEQDARLQSLRVRRNSPAPAPDAAPAAATEVLQQMLTDFEKALADGEFAKARPLDTAIAELRARSSGTSRSLARRIDAAHHAFEGLAGWQRWGSAQAHEQLCREAEALLEKPLPPAELARSVRGLRERWKGLDRDQGTAPAGLWHRFDKLCTRAYEPARKHFAEQVRQRRENVAARETFCAEVTAQAEALAATSPAAKDLQRQIEAWQRRWREFGPVDRPKWKALDARFAAAVEPAKRQVDEAVAASRTRRKQLIDAAAALAPRPIREAVGEVKSLQAAWKEAAAGVMLPRSEERRLWEAFRAACDAVFQRRDAESKALGKKRDAAAAARTALLDEFEQVLAASAGETAGQLGQALATLDAKWQAAGTADRDADRRLGERRAALENAARARVSAARRSRHFAVFDALAARARLCEEAEALGAASVADPGERVAALREKWLAAPPLPSALEGAVLERFERAVSGRTPEEAAAAARPEVLLRAEILSGLDSPAEEARERMALRVEYLNRRVSGDAPNELAEMQAVAARWAGLPGRPTDAQRARWDRAVRAFQARSSGRPGGRQPSG